MGSASKNRKPRGPDTSDFFGVRERRDRGPEVDFKWYGKHRFHRKVESPEIGKVIHDLARAYEGRTKRLNLDKVSLQEFVVKHPLANVGEQFREQMKGEIIMLAPVFIQEHLRNHPLQPAPAPEQQELCLPPGREKYGCRQTDLDHILPRVHQDSLMETSVNLSFKDLEGIIWNLKDELSRKDAELSRKDAELSRKDAELSEKDATIASLQEHFPAANERAGKVYDNVADFLSDPNWDWSGAV